MSYIATAHRLEFVLGFGRDALEHDTLSWLTEDNIVAGCEDAISAENLASTATMS